MRIKEIELRLAAIAKEIDNPDADLDALEKEARALKAEAAEIRRKEEQRAKLIKDVTENGEMVREFGIDATDGEQRTLDVDSAEYRSAYLKNMRGLELSEIEQRALNSGLSSAGHVIPTVTQNKIIEKVTQYAPLLEKIELLHVPDLVKVPAEGTTTEAQKHAEGATISGDEDTLGYVQLAMFEVTKLVTISKTVEKMSIDAFESWLVNKIARKVADKITGWILTGTGSSEPQGVDAISWSGTNSVEVGAEAKPTEADLDKLVGLLNGGYDDGAFWVMSKKTFFNEIRPIQNKSKNDVVVKEGGKWFVEGYPVEFDDRFKESEAILGNFGLGYLGNLPEEATITSQFVVRENSYDFLGSAMFDGKVQAVEAFVKLKKGA